MNRIDDKVREYKDNIFKIMMSYKERALEVEPSSTEKYVKYMAVYEAYKKVYKDLDVILSGDRYYKHPKSGLLTKI